MKTNSRRISFFLDWAGQAVVVKTADMFKAGTTDWPKLTGQDGIHLAPDNDTCHLAAFFLVVLPKQDSILPWLQ